VPVCVYRQNSHLFVHYAQLVHCVYVQEFLADRTNGRAYATMLRLSVCRL